MKITMNFPDELIERADKARSSKNMNRTQYFVNAVSEMCKLDEFKLTHPDFEKALLQAEESMKLVQSQLDAFEFSK